MVTNCYFPYAKSHLLVISSEELESISEQGGLGGEVRAGWHVPGQDVAEGVQLDVLQLQAGVDVVGDADSTCSKNRTVMKIYLLGSQSNFQIKLRGQKGNVI